MLNTLPVAALDFDRVIEAIQVRPRDKRPYSVRDMGRSELRSFFTDIGPFILAEMNVPGLEQANREAHQCIARSKKQIERLRAELAAADIVANPKCEIHGTEPAPIVQALRDGMGWQEAAQKFGAATEDSSLTLPNGRVLNLRAMTAADIASAHNTGLLDLGAGVARAVGDSAITFDVSPSAARGVLSHEPPFVQPAVPGETSHVGGLIYDCMNDEPSKFTEISLVSITPETIAKVAQRTGRTEDAVFAYLNGDEQDGELLAAFLFFGIGPCGKTGS